MYAPPRNSAIREIGNAQIILLVAGVSVPVLYFGPILVASLFYPGYSHARQFASELGAQGAPSASAAIFNTGTIACGAAETAGSLGMFGALRRLHTSLVVSILTASALGAFGVSDVISGLFPLPDPRHHTFGLGYAILVAPPLLVLATWKRRDMLGLKLYSIASGLALGAMVAILMGVGALVTRANIGALQRLAALACHPWIGVASYVLLRRSVRGGAPTGHPVS